MSVDKNIELASIMVLYMPGTWLVGIGVCWGSLLVGDYREIPEDWAARDSSTPETPNPVVGQRWVCGEDNEILEIRSFFDKPRWRRSKSLSSLQARSILQSNRFTYKIRSIYREPFQLLAVVSPSRCQIFCDQIFLLSLVRIGNPDWRVTLPPWYSSYGIVFHSARRLEYEATRFWKLLWSTDIEYSKVCTSLHGRSRRLHERVHSFDFATSHQE